MIKASCTWGDGPDVMLTFEDDRFILYEDPKNDPPPAGQWLHGYVSNGSTDLTQEQARQLAYELLKAADACREIEEAYKDMEGEM